MLKVDEIKRKILSLSSSELAKFRAWFAEFDHAHWDKKLAEDAASGKLDALAKEALSEHDA